jgi:TRAP-type C4-dicarboxylate transport system permease small subunit
MKKIYDVVCTAEMFLAKYLLLVLACLVFGAALARSLNYPIVWALDMATFLFAWCVFLGGDIAIRQDRLFCIVMLTEKLPPKTQVLFKIINYAIIAAFLAAMIVLGVWLSYTTRVRPFQGIPGFSYTWVTISVPIGCLLMLLTVIDKIRGFFKALREGALIRKDQTMTEII